MCHACTPILLDVASPVSEILLLSKTVKFPFQTMDLQSIVVKKINQSELAQNIHANRGRLETSWVGVASLILEICSPL